MVVNRSRLHDLTKGRKDLQTQFRWETVNAVLYKIGGFFSINCSFSSSLWFEPS
jgi:hypothetical protein